MSSDYRMNLIWASHGEQFRADLDRNIGQLGQFQRGMRQSGQQMGMWGQQMKAVSTTLRYALSGALVYGAASAVSGLADFQKRLGEIDSLAGKMDSQGRLQGLGKNLDELGDFAIQMSNKWGVAVDDIQQSMIAFYSSFDVPAGRKGLDTMRDYVEVMQQLNLITEGADPTAMARGLASLSIASGRGPSAAGNFRDIISSVISQSPVIRGEDIARDAGRLAAAQTASGMSPEQVFATYLMASKAGGSGAQIGRGVGTLLQQSIVSPTSKKAREAFTSIGLPTDPNALRALGGMTVLKRMMAASITGPVKVRNRNVLGDESVDDATALNQAGVSGVNISLASRLIPQQWALRQFLGMLSQGGPKALDGFIKSLQEAEKTQQGAQRARIVQDQSTLQRTQQAQKNLFLQVTRGFSPVLNAGGRAVIGASDAANRLGPTGTAAVLGGTVAANMAMKLLFGAGMIGMGGRGIGKLLGGRGASALGKMGLGRLVGRSGEMGAAALVGSGVGAFSTSGIGEKGAGSRTNPFWVIIDPLSWFMPGAPSGAGGSPTSPGGGTTPPVGWFGRAKGASRGVKIARFAKGAGLIAAADLVYHLPGEQGMQASVLPRDQLMGAAEGHPRLQHFLANYGRRRKAGRESQGEIDHYVRYLHGGLSSDQFEAWLTAHSTRQTHMARGVHGAAQAGGVALTGEALMTIALEASPWLKKALGEMDQKHHVPVKLWPKGGGGSPPQSRGKQKAPSGSAGGR